MKRLFAFLKTLALPDLAAIGLGVLLVVVVLSSIFSGVISHYRDLAFDRKLQEAETKAKEQEKLSIEAQARAKQWEARAAEAEANLAINEAIAKAAGAKAEKLEKDLQNEDQRFKQEIEAADQPVDYCVRILRICERAKDLGLFPKAKICTCTEPE